MVYDAGEQRVVPYRPRRPHPRSTKRSMPPSPSCQTLMARRHKLSHIASPSADTLGSISQRFTVQDFCRSVTSSESSPIGPHSDGDSLADGIVIPAKLPRRPEPVAGIARLINAWNPKMTLKPSNFKESTSASESSAEVSDRHPLARPGSESSSPSPPLPFSARHKDKHRRPPSRSCFSCGEKQTPKWRCGPSGINTLCNVCGLIYAKRQRKADRHHHHHPRTWRRSHKMRRYS